MNIINEIWTKNMTNYLFKSFPLKILFPTASLSQKQNIQVHSPSPIFSSSFMRIYIK